MYARAAIVLDVSYSGISNFTGNLTREQAIVEALRLFHCVG